MAERFYNSVRLIRRFTRESNAIEGIKREPSDAEIEAHVEFLLGRGDLQALRDFVVAIEPINGRLRRHPGMNVRVGDHVPLSGGPLVVSQLETLLEDSSLTPYTRHIAYEHLHPFLDGNGRSGRVLWLKDMGGLSQAPLGFLHTFYYQTFEAND